MTPPKNPRQLAAEFKGFQTVLGDCADDLHFMSEALDRDPGEFTPTWAALQGLVKRLAKAAEAVDISASRIRDVEWELQDAGVIARDPMPVAPKLVTRKRKPARRAAPDAAAA